MRPGTAGVERSCGNESQSDARRAASDAIGFAEIVSADQCESGGTMGTRARARASKAPHWPRGQVDSRSRDAALDVIQQSLFGMAVADDVKDEEDHSV